MDREMRLGAARERRMRKRTSTTAIVTREMAMTTSARWSEGDGAATAVGKANGAGCDGCAGGDCGSRIADCGLEAGMAGVAAAGLAGGGGASGDMAGGPGLSGAIPVVLTGGGVTPLVPFLPFLSSPLSPCLTGGGGGSGAAAGLGAGLSSGAGDWFGGSPARESGAG